MNRWCIAGRLAEVDHETKRFIVARVARGSFAGGPSDVHYRVQFNGSMVWDDVAEAPLNYWVYLSGTFRTNSRYRGADAASHAVTTSFDVVGPPVKGRDFRLNAWMLLGMVQDIRAGSEEWDSFDLRCEGLHRDQHVVTVRIPDRAKINEGDLVSATGYVTGARRQEKPTPPLLVATQALPVWAEKDTEDRVRKTWPKGRAW